MIIFIYLALIGSGMYWATKMLLPEMRKPSSPKNTSPKKSSPVKQAEMLLADSSPSGEPVNRIEKLESFLDEKNKNINLLQTELKILYAQIRDYGKVKALLEEEIHRLREQNRIFRSELGMPTVQPKENSIV